MKKSTIHLATAPLVAAVAALAVPQEGTPTEAASPRAMRADDVMSNWPETSRKVAREIIDQYGQPDGVTQTMLVWNENGPWLQTIVYRDPVQHDFPKPHQDVVEQFIGYQVPADLFDELARYDGSVICERTKGVISARCDKEAMNFLALNLAHDIVQGNRTVEEARNEYAKIVKRFMEGDKDPYTQELKFQPQPDAGDPDQPVEAG